MTRDELLQALADSQAELLAALDGLSEAEVSQVGVMEGWSAKDLLAHVTGWEAELLKAMAQGRAGKRPGYISITPAEETARNEQWRKEFQRKPLAKVLEDYREVRAQMIKQVARLDDAALTDPRQHKWTDGQSLAAIIVDGTVDHDREHAAQIREWRERAA